MSKATETEHAYFARIARQNRRISRERPPASLEDALARMEAIRRTHGALARPGVVSQDEPGDLDGHLRFLAHTRAVLERRGKERA